MSRATLQRGIIDALFEQRWRLDEYRQALAALQLPAHIYVVFFTPRSASTWLTELLRDNGELGNPDEWLLPEAMPGSIRQRPAGSLDRYIRLRLAQETDARTRFAGLQITFFQLQLLNPLCDVLDVLQQCAPVTLFDLRREDLLAQAVSLHKAVVSGVFHSRSGEPAPDVAYDRAAIAHWIEHIRVQEEAMDQLYQARGLNPIRLVSEQILSQGPATVLDVFRSSLGLPSHGGELIAPAVRKISTPNNRSLAEQYRADAGFDPTAFGRPVSSNTVLA